jgi:anti-anti-sigma factor
MSTTTNGGTYYYARTDDVCVIRPVGTITWKASADFERFLDRILKDSSVRTFFVDLSKATYIDSTNLGLLARIHLATSSSDMRAAFIYSTHPAINSILSDVGFTEIFGHADTNPYESVSLRPVSAAEDDVDHRQVILEAHRDLARLNGRNRNAFQPVVDEMERDMDRDD